MEAHMIKQILSAAAISALGLGVLTACSTVTSLPHITKTVIVKVPVPQTPSSPSALPTPPPAVPAQAPAYTNASAVVAQFYQDITDQDYSAAWNLGGVNIGGASYDTWVKGYSTTASISLSTDSNFGEDQVQANLVATQTDGSVQTYSGNYTVNNGVIASANIEETS
jgi:hypothetical protein